MRDLWKLMLFLVLTGIGCGQQLVEFGLTAPTVTSTHPTRGAVNVALDSKVAATFSEAMDPATIDAKTFTLKQRGILAVAGKVTSSGKTATFAPAGPLAANTVFTATITVGAKNKAGTSLSADYVWTFNSGAALDTTPPTVTFTDPADKATGVALNTAINVGFSEPMDTATITASTFTLADGATPVAGKVTYAGTTATFTPTSPLAVNTAFTGTVTTGVKDLAGNALAKSYVWQFTTGASVDTTAPTVILTDPTSNAISVPLGSKVTAAFSESMDATTLTTATFTLAQGATAVAGTVTYLGTTATFTPGSALAANTSYTATITTGAKDLAGNALAANYVWQFTTGAGIDTTAPTVSFTDPADKATGVAVTTKVSAAFSEVMDATTILPATFFVTRGGVQVAGLVTYSGTTATFAPASSLPINSLYTATITTGAKDLDGNPLAADYVWQFTTGAGLDTTAPTVSFTDPADKATGVGVTTKVSAAFSEVMDPTTILPTTFLVTRGGVQVAGLVTYSGTTATFTPASNLAINSVYTATITTGAKDADGNALAADHVWSFSTSGPPAVISTNPVDNAMGVPVNRQVDATFSEPMDPLTINGTTFTVMDGLMPIVGVVTYQGTTATFTPTGTYPLNATLTATVTKGAKDPSGAGLAQDYVWTFQTGSQMGIGGVPLGAASTYAILAFNTVTNVTNPGTVVTGDLGISPGAALIGFPPGQIVGSTHLGDAMAAAAKAALLMAYNDAVSRLGAAVLPGDLSGLTFTPGLYKNSTSVMLSAGNCTLDAQGDANAVFIFQMGSTLTTNAGTQFILSGSAKATNVYWAVGTSATLGTNSKFKGTILAAAAITMKTGASIEGRLLAQAAAVALDTNLITVPAP